MRQTFTLAAVLVFFTVCSFGQKKEIMQHNLHSTNSLKARADQHILHGMIHEKHGNLHSDFLTTKAKTNHPSDLKSAEAVKQRLDSIVSYTDANAPDYKVHFTYDSKGNNTQEIEYGWDSNTNTWVAEKSDYTYDASGNMTQAAYYDWDSNTNAWVSFEEVDYTYDSNGNLTQYSYTYLDSNNNIYGRKYDYSYDANGNMVQKLEYEWNSTTNVWVASSRYKYERTYFANGNIAQELEYYWNSFTNAWVVSFKTDYSYDSQGNNTQEVAYSWDPWVTNTWVGYSKTDYTYDASRHLIQRHNYNWNSNTNAWVYRDNESATYYTYDVNGNQTSEIRYDFDKTTSQLILGYKYEISYNLSYTLSDLIFSGEWIYYDIMINMPLEESDYDWDKASNSWVDDEKYVYYYSEINFTAVPKTVASGIDIYPNPASDYIKVSGVTGFATFNLYNLQGKLVLSKTLTNNEPVNVSGLSRGAYTYNIITDRKQQAGKIIKK